MFRIRIDHHHHSEDSEFNSQILKTLKTIMGQLEEINEKVSGLESQVAQLQVTVDNDQASDAAVVLALNAQNADLQAQIVALNEQIANGATPEQLAEISARLSGVSESIAATALDVQNTAIDGTVPVIEEPAPTEPTPESGEEGIVQG